MEVSYLFKARQNSFQDRSENELLYDCAVGRLREWWHAGEERAVNIHRTDIAGPLAILLLSAVLGFAYLLVLLPDQVLNAALIAVLANAQESLLSRK